MEPSINYKRLRDHVDEIEEPELKKRKSELNNNTVNNEDHINASNENEKEREIRRKKEESHFLRLFTLILNTLITEKKVNDIFICQSIISIKESYKFDCGPSSFSAIDFNRLENICGYLYRYASHGAGFARFRIVNAIRNCTVVKEVLKKPDLRIIFLGTGPGNDALGLCSALSELHCPKSLKITLVDKFKRWSLCINLAKELIEKDSFGKMSELFRRSNVELLFIETDLPGSLTSDEKYFQNLEGADVIVMSKLVSTLDKSNDREAERAIMKSLNEHAKEDAVILLNDTFSRKAWSDFYLIYSWGDQNIDHYMSSALAKRRFNHTDAVSSKLPINVLVKKEPPEILSIFKELPDDFEFQFM